MWSINVHLRLLCVDVVVVVVFGVVVVIVFIGVVNVVVVALIIVTDHIILSCGQWMFIWGS